MAGTINSHAVSILVLMDSSLQCLGRQAHYNRQTVSILVLMDSSLQSCDIEGVLRIPKRFNPCFNGFFSSMPCFVCLSIKALSFNPCFNGFFSSIGG